MRQYMANMNTSRQISINLMLAISILLALNLVQSYAYNITDCTVGKEADAKITSVVLEDCPTSGEFCPFVQGKNATITVDFETTAPFEMALVKIYGRIGGLSLPFPITPSDACGNYGFACPVKASESKRLHISLPVQRAFPRLSLTVRLNLQDEKSRPIICIEFPAKIVSGNE